MTWNEIKGKYVGEDLEAEWRKQFANVSNTREDKKDENCRRLFKSGCNTKVITGAYRKHSIHYAPRDKENDNKTEDVWRIWMAACYTGLGTAVWPC
jgi:hypothetical protein